jgi:hypothetical protein
MQEEFGELIVQYITTIELNFVKQFIQGIDKILEKTQKKCNIKK